MRKFFASLSLIIIASFADSTAQASCSWTTIANGATADATQVMNNLDCLAPQASPNFTGRVGIGTASPSEPLQVVGGSDGWSGIALGDNGGNKPQVSLRVSDNSERAKIELTDLNNSTYGDNLGLFSFSSVGVLTQVINLRGNGLVGIGTATPGYTLEVNGSVAGTGPYNALSDARLKKNIKPIHGALALIDRLQGVHFDWRSPVERSIGKDKNLPVGKPQIGFIAQELERVLPEAISIANDKDHTMSVAESKVVPILVEAMKEQKAIIERQASEILGMHKELSFLERKVATRTASR